MALSGTQRTRVGIIGPGRAYAGFIAKAVAAAAVTPRERIYGLTNENRTYPLVNENRTYALVNENRTYGVRQ